jgi:RNA polymerase sigma-70 factor (ECF subfamily)
MKHAIRTSVGNPPVEPLVARLEDLLRQVALGDVQAFEALYARMSGPVYGLSRRVLRNAPQAEEVTQEVLLWIWREAARFDETQGSAMAWMMTVAHRRAVDRVRSEQRGRALLQRAAMLDVQRSFDSVSEEILSRLDGEAVRRCLGALTAIQREAVVLAYYGGHTYAEVAEILELPLGTAKTRIRDGLIRLRDGLDPAIPATGSASSAGPGR